MLGAGPDLCYAVSYLGRFTQSPSPKHWTAICHVFCYIKLTLDLGLLYTNSKSPLFGFANYSHLNCWPNENTLTYDSATNIWSDAA